MIILKNMQNTQIGFELVDFGYYPFKDKFFSPVRYIPFIFFILKATEENRSYVSTLRDVETVIGQDGVLEYDIDNNRDIVVMAINPSNIRLTLQYLEHYEMSDPDYDEFSKFIAQLENPSQQDFITYKGQPNDIIDSMVKKLALEDHQVLDFTTNVKQAIPFVLDKLDVLIERLSSCDENISSSSVCLFSGNSNTHLPVMIKHYLIYYFDKFQQLNNQHRIKMSNLESLIREMVSQIHSLTTEQNTMMSFASGVSNALKPFTLCLNWQQVFTSPNAEVASIMSGSYLDIQLDREDLSSDLNSETLGISMLRI